MKKFSFTNPAVAGVGVVLVTIIMIIIERGKRENKFHLFNENDNLKIETLQGNK